jgi:hypothetical protein
MEDDRAVRFGVERRLELLATLRDGTDRAALADRLGVSPTTVDRGVDELADAIAGPVHPPQLTAGGRIDGGTTVRVALGGAALGTLAGRGREGLRPTLEGATVRFGVFGGEFPYTLLSARTAEGPVVGLLTAGGYVETGDAAAVDRTADRFATVWADCDPLPVYDGDG